MKRLLGVSDGTLVDVDSRLVIHVAAVNKLSRDDFSLLLPSNIRIHI